MIKFIDWHCKKKKSLKKSEKELQDFAAKSSDNKLKDDIYLTLMKKTEVQFPAAFLKNILKHRTKTNRR